MIPVKTKTPRSSTLAPIGTQPLAPLPDAAQVARLPAWARPAAAAPASLLKGQTRPPPKVSTREAGKGTGKPLTAQKGSGKPYKGPARAGVGKGRPQSPKPGRKGAEAVLDKNAEAKEAARIARGIRVGDAQWFLRENYPAVFSVTDPKPLAIGVFQELRKRHPENLSFHDLKGALFWWCTWKPYLRALAAGGPRFNLEGEIVGDITPDQQVDAVKRLTGD